MRWLTTAGGQEQLRIVAAREPDQEDGEMDVEVGEQTGLRERLELRREAHRSPPMKRSSASTSARARRSRKTPHAPTRAGSMPRRKR